MKFAIVNNVRTEPSPRLKGVCCCCGEPMTSRCGSKRVWHWAHLPNQHCDPWWENETQWHRKWKSYFPEENQEVVHFDSATGEKHVADIKSKDGLVVELQNSPMDSVELHSRENFYREMIWIVNGDKFKNNFRVLGALPNPKAEFARDIVFFPQNPNHNTYCFWRRSEQPNHKPGDMVHVHFLSEEWEEETRQQIIENYLGHHMFEWKRPRSVWFDTRKPVYMDFGSDRFLLQLKVYQTYGERSLWCIQYTSKQMIIESCGGEYAVPESGA